MSAVIPGLEILFGQQGPGEKFTAEDQQGVKAAPQGKTKFMGHAEYRAQKGGTAVDGKHPEGGGTLQLEVAPFEHFACRIEDFNAPSRNAAVKEQFRERHGGCGFLCF